MVFFVIQCELQCIPCTRKLRFHHQGHYHCRAYLIHPLTCWRLYTSVTESSKNEIVTMFADMVAYLDFDHHDESIKTSILTHKISYVFYARHVATLSLIALTLSCGGYRCSPLEHRKALRWKTSVIGIPSWYLIVVTRSPLRSALFVLGTDIGKR